MRDEKKDVDKICVEVQKTSDYAGGKPTRGFSLQHKTFNIIIIMIIIIIIIII